MCQNWLYEVHMEMDRKGCQASMLHQSVFYLREKKVLVVIHVGDFLCVGPWAALEELYYAGEAKYFNRGVRRAEGGISWEVDPKRFGNLQSEYGMQERSAAPTPITKDGSDKGCVTGGTLSPIRPERHTTASRC